jgi:ferredoxin, 2Fe-2S
MGLQIIKVVAFDRDGTRREVEAKIGFAMMWSLREQGLPIEALCGGCASCGTCHVYVAEEWVDRLPARTKRELDLLEALGHFNERQSRLSCQIQCEESMHGVTVTLAPEE